jgi:predicted negative regulator of RcsB-dependent stress response
MSRDTMLVVLFAFTFIAVIGWAIWQRTRTKQSQRRSGDPDGRQATSDALHAHKDGPEIR